MFALTSEFIIGLLIGIILGYSFYYKIHKDQLHIINQKIDELINLMESKKNLSLPDKLANVTIHQKSKTWMI